MTLSEDLVRAWSDVPGATRGRALAATLAPLLLILLLAAALRLPEIRSPLDDAFSWREASTAMMADNFHQRNWNVLFPEVSWTGPGPSYQGREFQVISYVTAVLYALFGWHDWFGRAVAAVFGLWSVAALYALILRLWGRTQACAGALMLALLPGAVIIDTSFLPDPAMTAFALTGLWALVGWLQTDRPLWLVAAAVFLALGVLAKPPGVAVLAPAAYAAASILTRRGAVTRGRLLALGGLLAAIALPAAAYFSWAVHLGNSYPPYHVAGAGFVWDDIAGAVREGFHLKAAAKHALLWFLTLPFILLFGLGLFAAAPKGARHAPWLFHVWLAGGGILYLFASKELTVNPWNLLIFAAPAAALAGRGLLAAVRSAEGRLRTGPAQVRAAALVLLLTWSAVGAVTIMKTPYAAAGRELGEKLAGVARPGDLVVTAVSDIGDPVAIYYSRHRGWVFPPGGGSDAWNELPADRVAIADLERLRRSGADWFGLTRDATDAEDHRLLDHNPGLVAHLDRVGRRVVDDKTMVIWRLPPL